MSSDVRSVRLGGTLPVDCTGEECPWLPRSADRAIFIPVGSNSLQSEPQNQNSGVRSANILTVAVFGVRGGSRSCDESADISYVIRQAISTVASLRLVVMGRGAAESEATLRRDLDESGVVLRVLGVLPPEQIQRQLLIADVLLCVRGHISTRNVQKVESRCFQLNQGQFWDSLRYWHCCGKARNII